MTTFDPLAGGKAGEQSAIDAPAGFCVQVLKDSVLAQPGTLQPRGELPFLPLHELHIHDEGQPVLERQVVDLGTFQLRSEPLGHAGEPHAVELVDSRVDKHFCFRLCCQ
jgi:hypothetical protein